MLGLYLTFAELWSGLFTGKYIKTHFPPLITLPLLCTFHTVTGLK